MLMLLVPVVGQAAPCPWVVSPQASQQLYDNLRALPAADCALDDQTVQQGVVAEVWKRGELAVPLHWSPRACVSGEDGRLAPVDLPAFAAKCPQTARQVQETSESVAFPAATKPVPRGKTQVLDAEYDLVLVTALLEVAALLGLLAWLGLAGRRALQLPVELRRDEKRWWQAGAALLLLALLLRFAVPPTLSNWYTTVLSQGATPKVDRYGSGHIAMQWLLRSVLPWGDRALFGANQVLGAAIVPLWLVVLRQRAFDLRTAVLAAGLLAVLPLHVRLTNSASEHVLAAFLWLAALATWQSAMRARARSAMGALGLLAAVLALLTALTRVDAAAPLAAIAGWTLLVDRCEQPLALSRRTMATLLWLAVWLLAIAFVLPLVRVAVVEQGTPMPHLAERLDALRAFVPGMRRLMFGHPGWIGPLVGSATLVGLLVGLRQRPLLTLTALATILTIPLGIGRSPYDFIMMRYYLPLLPLVTIFAALALAPLVRRRWVTPLLLGAVVLLAWPAWQLRYTFQDEYAWLREQLQQQPADCTVAQIGVSHHRNFFLDLDCCLDLPRSPLVAALPGRQFVLTDTAEELRATPGACRLYYEGAVCALEETAELKQRNPQELKWFKRQCAELRQTPGLAPVAEAIVSPYAHTDAFAGKPVTVKLSRLAP